MYEMLVLAFGIGPGPRIFTKLMKVPLTVLRRLLLIIIAYLDDLLLIGRTLEEALMARDSVLFLLQVLGFTINWEKSVLQPTQVMEFLGMKIDSQKMEISLPEEKLTALKDLCKQTLKAKTLSVRELASLIGKLYATLPAVSMAPLQIRSLQQDLIRAQSNHKNYENYIQLSQEAKEELQWWLNNLQLVQGRPVRLGTPDMVIYSDASSHIGWGAAVEGGMSTGGVWTQQEKDAYHINELELMGAELALQTFVKDQKMKLVHLFMDNMTALSYIANKGGTKSVTLTSIAKRILTYLQDRGITITVSWIPSHLNKRADFRSRQKPNSSEWKLNTGVFARISRKWGTPKIDCFASRTTAQLPQYMSLNPDPNCMATNALYQQWGEYPYLFPPFCLLGRVLKLLQVQETPKALIVAPLWPGQPWYPVLLQMVVANPILLPKFPKLLENHQGQIHPLLANKTLSLGAFLVSSSEYKQREYRRDLPKSWPVQEDQGPSALTSRLGKDGFCGVIRGRLIPLDAL